MSRLLSKIKKQLKKRKWRKRNSHNQTVVDNIFNFDQVNVGRYTYGSLKVLTFNNHYSLVIGDFCSIASDVVFVLEADHPLNCISTFPFMAKCLNEGEMEATSKGNIIIQDDVWIGHGAIILSGVTVGQGAVIAAGAVVTSDVPPYSIFGGIPAKQIRKRFSDETIAFLQNLNYRKLTEDLIREHKSELLSPIKELSVAQLEKKYEWFPKKCTGN